MLDEINRTRSQHIVTIEDPIEMLHHDQKWIVNQREVGLDTENFGQALRRALRQDPDIILIGELRDTETAEVALQAAESGHLVFSTMHTLDAAETVGRLVEYFPREKQAQVVSILAGVLRGVVSQRLLPRLGGGRAPAVEVMVNNNTYCRADPRAAHRRDPGGDRGRRVLRDADAVSMALLDLVLGDYVDRETAAERCAESARLRDRARARREGRAVALEESTPPPSAPTCGRPRRFGSGAPPGRVVTGARGLA